LFRILGAFQQRAFGSSTLIAMKIAKNLKIVPSFLHSLDLEAS